MANTASVRILPTTNNNARRSLTEAGINSILGDILDSMIKYPKQSTEERASETARIARKRKVTNLQVAAIRANLSRGTYGNVRTLMRNRKNSLSASA